jgi:PhnB protein
VAAGLGASAFVDFGALRSSRRCGVYWFAPRVRLEKPAMPQVIAYLAFDGTCAEAMRFYERALGGQLEVLMSGADSPIADQIPAESAHRILHARLALPDGGTLYGGDAPGHVPYGGIKGVSVTLNYGTTAQAEAAFAALAEGGQVTMPMQPAFWAKSWGMLVDRFGTPWIVNGELVPL